MLAHAENQFRARRLVQITHLPAQQSKRRILQLRQVECKRNLPRKRWLDRVPVGGNYVDRVGTGQRRHVQIRQLAQQTLFVSPVAIDVKKERSNNQQG